MMGSVSKRPRESSIELLRIISMLLIIVCHCCGHGVWPNDISVQNDFFVNFFWTGGAVGVICFVMISGYFMVSSGFKTRSLLRVVLETWFYPVVLLAIVAATGVKSLGAGDVVHQSVPLVWTYWFASSYVVMYLLSPALNRIAKTLSERSLKRILLVLFCVLVILPTLTNSNLAYSAPFFFCFLYLVAAYLRLYDIPYSKKFWLCLLVAVQLFLVLVFIALELARLSGHDRIYSLGFDYFLGISQQNGGRTLVYYFVTAVALFSLFAQMRIGHVRWINKLASGSFGVYLIHDNAFVRELLWPHFSQMGYLYPALFALSVVCLALLVYLTCSLVDLLRQRYLEKPFMAFLERKGGRFLNATDQWFCSIESDGIEPSGSKQGGAK